MLNDFKKNPRDAAAWNSWVAQRTARKPVFCACGCGNKIRPNNQWGMCRKGVNDRGVPLKASGYVKGITSKDLTKKIAADFRAKHAPDWKPEKFPYVKKKADWTDQRKSPRHRIAKGNRMSKKCLSCCGNFLSEGPHNRICDACKTTSAWQAGCGGDFSRGAWAGQGMLTSSTGAP